MSTSIYYDGNILTVKRNNKKPVTVVPNKTQLPNCICRTIKYCSCSPTQLDSVKTIIDCFMAKYRP